MSTKLELPKYAFPYAHPAAGRGDVGAEFRGDDGMTICVSLERGMESGQINFGVIRGGLNESGFTRDEFSKILELTTILFNAHGKQPERMK